MVANFRGNCNERRRPFGEVGEMNRPATLGELRKSKYVIRPVKDELRENLIERLRRKEPLFPGIIGYEHTVIPALTNAILARHDIILLGLRGQAKTRIVRQLHTLLDEYTPVVKGSEINDNPFAPVSKYAVDLVQATRTPAATGMPDLAPVIALGASPRATLALVRGAPASRITSSGSRSSCDR